MLADQDYSPLKKRAPQLPAVEEQLAFQELSRFWHIAQPSRTLSNERLRLATCLTPNLD
jgi:hypothetical protein